MSDPFDPLKKALADRYAVESKIGQGGMATVYLAEDIRHHRKVAVKVLRSELSALLGEERFLKEIELTANLQHPNILPLYDSGSVSNEGDAGAPAFLYYVMPYIEGESLREKLEREKQLTVDEAVAITKSVAAALDYAHGRGIIHRDVKPANILLQSGQALVADFGIAIALSAAGGKRLTETGLSLGTPHYMSPEQATGDRQLDARSDIYSLGAILYEMLTGDPPHSGTTIQSVVAKILSAEPDPVANQRSTIPPNVAAAVHKALCKLPADRFGDAGEFAKALSNPGFTFSTTATRVATAFVDKRWRRRAIAAAGLAGAMSVLALWGWIRPQPQSPVSHQRVALWSEQPTAAGVGGETAIAPDGSAIAFVDTLQGQRRLFVKERDRLTPAPVTDAVNPAGPFFSPDGAWIGFWLDGELKTVPRRGGAIVTVADSVQRLEPAGAWLDDGSIVFARGNRIMRVAAEGGPVIPASNDAISGLWYLAPLPDARGVLFSSCGGSCHRARVETLDLQSRETKTVLEDAILASYIPTGHLIYLRPDGGVFGAPFDLESLSLDGDPVKVLEGVATVGPAAVLTIAADGTLLYLAGPQIAPTGLSEAVWVERDGSISPVDPTWAFRPAQESGLSLSPDGSMVALGVEEDLKVDVWVKQLPDGPFSRLTFADSVSYRPSWTSDGQTVMYVARVNGACDLMTRRADGSSPPQPRLRGHNACLGRVSGNGEWLVFRADGPDGRGDIMAIHSTAVAEPIELIATEFHETSPELSPDGRWLAYASDESGRPEVYLRPFPNIEAGRWVVSTAGGSMPFWAHSGDELFYISAAGELVSAEIGFGPPLRTVSRTLFSMAIEFSGVSNDRAGVRMFDVSHDDRRFLALRGDGAERMREKVDVVLVENWLEELRITLGS